uniref:Aldose 1-epimerase n=1 Tax=Quercus lobata TaxID=97700 RepID=A0A7N2MQJ9_QUELO
MADQNLKPELFELNNGTMRVLISNLGCTITSLCVPDKDGKLAAVVLGFDSLEPYLVIFSEPHLIFNLVLVKLLLGALISAWIGIVYLYGESKGIYSVKVATLCFCEFYPPLSAMSFLVKVLHPILAASWVGLQTESKMGSLNSMGSITLCLSTSPQTVSMFRIFRSRLYTNYRKVFWKPKKTFVLFCGHMGFDKKVWEATNITKGKNPSITFKYHSSDGEEGYPGDVSVTATYTLTSSTTMRLDMEAVPNKPTPISLAQHTYWNLAGHNSGNILDHSIQIRANHVTPVDQNTIPTGYDHNYVLDCGEEKAGLKHAAKVKDPSSSRILNLWSNAPGMQFYTGNYVNGVVGKGGAVYGKHAGLCLETQGFPNAINQPNFPSIVVQSGEKYQHTMLFEFSVE